MQSYAEGLAQQINVRKIEFIYCQARISCLGNLIAIALVLVFYWNLLPNAALLAWAAVTAMLLLYRWSMALAFKKRDRYADIKPWYQRYHTNVAFHGLAWGALFLLAALTLHTRELFVIVTILGALISATGIAYYGYLEMYLSFALPAVIPTVLVLLWRGSTVELALGASALCWLALVLSFAHQMRRRLNKSTVYEFSNVALLRELSALRAQSAALENEIERKQRTIRSLMLRRTSGTRPPRLHHS